MDGNRLHPARILVVEDGAEEQYILQSLLEFHDYAVMVAGDGERGLELARRYPPDLILLDLALPRLSGVEVARRLRASRDTAGIPVIVVTAYPDLFARDLRELGIPWYEKPIDPMELMARVKETLGSGGERERGGGRSEDARADVRGS